MAVAPASHTPLAPLDGEPRPLEEWVTTFHLVTVALDPFTHESAWIIDTAGRILTNFEDANCRVSWLVAGTDDEARSFLGPWADQVLTFADPSRSAIRAMAIERLPAIVHLDQALQIEGAAEGWDPEAWRWVADNLAEMMMWSSPLIPAVGDPPPFAGTPL